MATGQLSLAGFGVVARGRRDHARPLPSFLPPCVRRGPGFLELSPNWTHCQGKPGHCPFHIGASACPARPLCRRPPCLSRRRLPGPQLRRPLPRSGPAEGPPAFSPCSRGTSGHRRASPLGRVFFFNFTFDCHGNCYMFGKERRGEKLGEKKRRSQRGAGRRPGGSCRRAERGLWRAARLQRTKLSVPHVGGGARLAPLYGFPELPALAAVHRLQGRKQD